MPTRRNALRLSTLSLVLCLAPAAARAQTTGAVQGRVTNEKGKPFAGATVTLSGPRIQGVRTTTTDKQGRYRFNLVHPGPVKVAAQAKGYSSEAGDTQVQARKEESLEELLNTSIASQVALDQTATIDLILKPVAEATVEVVGESVSLDVKGTTVGMNYTPETFLKLPTSRDYADIASLAPGVTQDREGFKIYGGTGAENSFLVDGSNTTGIEFGTQGKQVPMEFIQEFQVKTGGYEAEYGRALGGVINVITKSGGNDFSGDVFAYSTGQYFKSGNHHQNDANLVTKPLLLEDKTFELGFDAGGALIKDRLWYFVAFDRRSNKQQQQIRAAGPNQGEVAPTDSDRDLYAAKLTWKVAEGHSLIASVVGDPEKISGAVKTPQGSRGTWEGEHKIGGTDLSLRYEVTGSSWFAQAQMSRHQEKNTILPGSGASAIQLIDQTNSGAQSGGFGRYDDKDFTRDNLTASFTWILGSHELKAGVDLQKDQADIHRGFTGGQLVTQLTAGANPVYSHYWWTSRDAQLTPTFDAPSIVFTSKPKHDSAAYYVQDKWTVAPGLTLNAGLRLDMTWVRDQFGGVVFSLKDQWAPRLGFIWDFKGKGQDKLYASFSRYYEQVPLDLVIRSFSVERNPTTYNYSQTDMTPNGGAETDIGTTSSIVGSYVEPVDWDIKGSYSDEYIIGAETTVKDLYLLGVKGIHRTLGRALEDGLDVNSPNGDYFIMNPGKSRTAGVTYPKAERTFNGLELSAQRKFAAHYQWQASYLWSHLYGNYEGAFQGIGGADGTGQLDPNINSAFDVPEFIVNSYGDLSGDRRHQVKANGYYEWDFGLSVGAAFQYLSGTPISRLGYHNGYGRYELFMLPRGTEGHAPSVYRLDLNLAYAVKLANKQQVRIIMDVTNVTNRQAATLIDQRFNAVEGGPMVSTYKQPFAFQAPRSVRLGVRYSF